ncbi:permease for cytosine/purines, uracil, thiamine, allantoin-domain-containing protein [Schizophyllum fasciatum]
MLDTEKGQALSNKDSVDGSERASTVVGRSRWARRLLALGVEERGVKPVPPEHRTDSGYDKIFFVWASMNTNILSFSAGTLGPVVYGLGLRDSCLVILFFNLLCAAPPAYFTTWGPKTGMRQMVQARYSFGYFGVILPCILNLIGMCGFCILNSILGGQTLASVSSHNLSWTVGIVIITVVSLFISFCGYKVLTWYERVAWIPVVIVYVVALGVGGKHLRNFEGAAPATPGTVLSFAATIVGFVVTYAPLASDFTIYFRPGISSLRLFVYSYLGFLLPIVPLQCLGAAVAGAASTMPEWEAGYAGDNVGGLVEAMLHPVGGFGKFLTVLLSLSVAGNIAATFYSMSLNLQLFVPFLWAVPRYVFSLLGTAIVIPLAVVGAHSFYDTLTNFLSLIGYWAGAFIAVVLVEHWLFRRADAAAYDPRAWNRPRALPSGIAAVGAAVGCFALVVPGMDQVWFVGPIAKTTGDLGFEFAFVAAVLLYIPFRKLEVRVRGQL